jgi:hypothetical protein
MRKILLIFGLIFPILSFAVTFDVDGLRYNILSQKDRTVEVAIIPKSLSYPSYSTYAGDYDIPAKVTFNEIQYDVIGIGQHAFSECYKLGVITLPNSIKYIGFGAFSYSNIASLTLPESVDSIGAAAFRDCHYLTEFTLPKGLRILDTTVFYGCYDLTKVTILSPFLTEIPDDTFFKCTSLSDITLPESITSLGAGAFYYTSNLSSLNIPNSVNKIGNQCFAASGITSIVIPDEVTELPGAMFSGCSKLKSIQLPVYLTELNKNMFSGCHSLETINIPEGLTNIPTNCFRECWALKEVHFPSSLKSISDGAFSDCRVLDNIVLPEGFIELGNEVFYNSYINNIIFPSTLQRVGGWCFGIGSEMRTLSLPVSLSYIGSCAFSKRNIQEVICMNPVPVECESNVFKNETYYGTLYVPKGSLDAYQSTKPWSDFFTIIEHNLSGINDITYDIDNSSVISFYNFSGLVSEKPFRGWNIVKYKNGSVRKIFIE